MHILRFFLVFIAVLFILPVQAKRIALVMGNDNYISVSKLQKAGNDATAMARELRSAGFTVQLHRDLNYRGMVKAVETFTTGITGGDEVVVFFAGHGVQIKSGSYLLPTDIEANSESEVEKTSYELLALTDKISEAKPAFSLVMVDACRDNPLKSKGRNIGNARGLSAIEPPKGQMVVYSASRGQQALDRLSEKDPNPNGVFTREFISQMKKPGIKIEDIMREVQDAVESLAKTVKHEQRPAVYNEARGNFYFYGPTTVQVAPLPPQKPDSNVLELALWDSAKTATTVAEVQAYLNRFPNGFFAEMARARIGALSSISAERLATENAQRIAEEARYKEQQRLALVAQNQDKVRIAQEVEQKEQERILADQRVKDQERVAALNAQKLADEKVKQEAERKLAIQNTNQELAKQRAAEQEKLLADEKKTQQIANRISLNATVGARPPVGGVDAESEKNSSALKTNLNEFWRILDEARLEADKRSQEIIRKSTPGLAFKDCDICPEMVVIPAGNFQMGSKRGIFSSVKPSDDELPQHRVSIQPFAIGKFEITQEQWKALMGNNPSRFISALSPVEQVSWDDAQEFTKKLSEVTGQQYRLPTEAEWEFAARSGTDTEFSFGDLAKDHEDFAFSKQNSAGKTNQVGVKKPNAFGLHDMHGNVLEWTQDCWKPSYSGAPTDGSANFANRENCRKVLRGGSWQTNPEFLRSAQRIKFPPEAKFDDLGLRVVRDLR